MRMKDNIVHPKDVEVKAAPVVFEADQKAEASVETDAGVKDPTREEADKAINDNVLATGKVKKDVVAPKPADKKNEEKPASAVPNQTEKKTDVKVEPAATVAGAVPQK